MAKNVRLLLHTAALSTSHENTFHSAAKTVKADYAKAYKADTILMKKVNNGPEIVKIIGDQEPQSIISLDIFSHGNQAGIHIAKKLPKPIKAGLVQARFHVAFRSGGPNPQTEADAEFMEESMQGLYTDSVGRTGVSYYYNQSLGPESKTSLLKDIDFTKFADNAYVEFHGCKTAEVDPMLNKMLARKNFAQEFSAAMKKGGFVVGHTTNSAPNRHPVNKSKSDYRYGKVRAYKDGKLEHDNVQRWGLKLTNSSTPP